LKIRQKERGVRAAIEAVIVKYACLLDFLGRLLVRPFRRPLGWLHPQLDRLLLKRPGFLGNLWRLFHRPDWQRSAKFSARMWVSGFAIFYPLASELGYGFWVNLGVTLGLDVIVYLFHKKRLWPARSIGYRKSYTTWYCFTMVTFFVNLGAAWILLEQIRMENAHAKVVLGVFGVVINPWVFKFRDKRAIPDLQPKTDPA
jgi:hypothetical protein